MNSTNWPAPNVWVFIELQNEYAYENKKANKKLHQTQQQINFTQRKTRKKELEKKFVISRLTATICNCLNCNYHWDGHIYYIFI